MIAPGAKSGPGRTRRRPKRPRSRGQGAPAGKRLAMRTLLVSDDVGHSVGQRLREFLRAKVDSQGPATSPLGEVEKRIAQVQPEMVVVVLSPDPDRGLGALRLARRALRGYVLAVGQASEPKLILRALQEGAD